jgi:hypothetical protein
LWTIACAMPTRWRKPCDSVLIADHVVAHAAERRRDRDLVDPLARFGAGEPADLRGEEEVFGDGHLVVERRVVGQVSHPGAHVVGVVDHVETVDPNAARRGKQVAREDAKGGRLAGAIQAEKADDFPLGDGE